MLDLTPEIESLWDELQVAIHRVLRSGQFILGPEVAAFEEEVARYLGVKHAIGVNSGTDALVIGLRALGIGPGDEVITTAFSFFATAEAISMVGAKPIFVDIDEDTLNLDPGLVEQRITPKTRAILPVHLYGRPAEMERIVSLAKEHGLFIVEDVAQGFGGGYAGRKLGTIGDIGAFSFFPSKNLGAFGDGGLITTDREDIAGSVRKLRAHGSAAKYKHEVLGYNSRLDSIQAAILRVKLPYVDRWNLARIQAAERYSVLLAGVPGLRVPVSSPDGGHVYHQYTVRVIGKDRDEVRRATLEAGVDTQVHYPQPLHRTPIFAGDPFDLPKSELAAEQVLSLPLWPSIEPSIQQAVASTLVEALS